MIFDGRMQLADHVLRWTEEILHHPKLGTGLNPRAPHLMLREAQGVLLCAMAPHVMPELVQDFSHQQLRSDPDMLSMCFSSGICILYLDLSSIFPLPGTSPRQMLVSLHHLSHHVVFVPFSVAGFGTGWTCSDVAKPRDLRSPGSPVRFDAFPLDATFRSHTFFSMSYLEMCRVRHYNSLAGARKHPCSGRNANALTTPNKTTEDDQRKQTSHTAQTDHRQSTCAKRYVCRPSQTTNATRKHATRQAARNPSGNRQP